MHTTILVLTSSCPASPKMLFFPPLVDWSLQKGNIQIITSTHNINLSYKSHVCKSLWMYQAYSAFNHFFSFSLARTMCIHKNFLFYVFHLYLHLAYSLSHFNPFHNSLVPFRITLCTNLTMFHATLNKNWQAALTSSSSHVILTLGTSNIPQPCPDTLCKLLIGHTTFPSFPQPTFWQWLWSPYHMDINNSMIHGSQFRK